MGQNQVFAVARRFVLAVALAIGAASVDPAVAQGIERDGTAGYAEDGFAIVRQGFLDETFKGDLTDLIRRGVVRVLVSNNRTSFAFLGGRNVGFEYELMMSYRKHLKTRVRKRSWPVQFIFIPLPFDDLLPALVEGRGDIVAAGLTVTPEREKLVAFTRPYIRDIDEIVVAAPSVGGLKTLDDLAGREVYIREGTSYAESLKALNRDFAARGLDPVELRPARPIFAKEDIFELLNVDAVDLTIADSHLASLWSQFFDNMVVRDDLVLRRGGQIAWAVRKENTELLESLNAFIRKSGQGTLIGNVILKRYFMQPDWFVSSLDETYQKRLRELSDLMVKYGERYGFDWRLLGALAFQESRLDHSVRSHVGAVGLMQVMEETAAAPPIEVMPIEEIEKNVEAGAKYLAFVRDTYFSDPEIGPGARIDFSLAAYNAGPTRISRLRKVAAKEGLDPNVWFDNVEKVVRRKVGLEPINYVGNINRHYLNFIMLDEAIKAREAGIQEVKR